MKKVTLKNNFQHLESVWCGRGVRIFDFVNLYGCRLGDGTKIGAFVEIQKGVYIGKNCKVSSHAFICEGVRIEDGVFIGHHVVFINDKYPRATTASGKLKTKNDWKIEKTLVKKGASVGSNATVLAGVTIGRAALVGAGAVVVHDVPEGAVVAGNPAKVMRYLPRK